MSRRSENSDISIFPPSPFFFFSVSSTKLQRDVCRVCFFKVHVALFTNAVIINFRQDTPRDRGGGYQERGSVRCVHLPSIYIYMHNVDAAVNTSILNDGLEVTRFLVIISSRAL